VYLRLKAAEKANSVHLQTIAHLNHALRTPLTTLTGAVEILETSQDSLDPNQRRIFQSLKSSVQTLKTIVNEIPDPSAKAKSGSRH